MKLVIEESYLKTNYEHKNSCKYIKNNIKIGKIKKLKIKIKIMNK